MCLVTLKLRGMKKELLVIVGHNTTVNRHMHFVHTARHVLEAQASEVRLKWRIYKKSSQDIYTNVFKVTGMKS